MGFIKSIISQLINFTGNYFKIFFHRYALGLTSDSYDLQQMANLYAAWSSAQYYCMFMTRSKIFSNKKDFLIHATKQCNIDGLHLEFGVADGNTIRIISSVSNKKIYGFDCFNGLPEDWRYGFEKGQFAHPIPSVPENVELIIGLFNETLPEFVQRHKDPVAFLHIDCDLYSSTKAIFNHLWDRIIPGTIIVFDEYLNYPGWQTHEFKAFQEFTKGIKIEYSYISLVPTHQQVCVRIDNVENIPAN